MGKADFTGDFKRDAVLRKGPLSKRAGRPPTGRADDNDVAERFPNLLRRERICRTRDKARRDAFDDIERFHTPTPKHARNGTPSPSGSNGSTGRKPAASGKPGAVHGNQSR